MIPRQAPWIFGLVLLTGCGITVENRSLPPTNPASADSAESPYVPPANFLAGELPAPPAKDGETDHHHHDDHQQSTGPTKPYPLNTCLVGGEELGKMGKPETLVYEGREIKFCCAACIATFKKDPAQYLKTLDEADRKGHPKETEHHSYHDHEEKK
jgi:YHS domain-containing protein